MIRSLLIVGLLASHALAETTVFPSPGKVAGIVISDVPGDWGVLASDLSPIVPKCLDGSKDTGWKVCTFEGAPGRYAVIKVPKGGGLEITPVVLGGAGPVTPPVVVTPGPPVNPQTPAPLPGMRVLVLEETGPTVHLPGPLSTALRSLQVRAYLDSKTLRDSQGGVGWRNFDPDVSLRNLPQEWQTIRAKLTPTSFPWVGVADSSGNVVDQRPYPATEVDALAYFRKYGG